MGRQRKNPQSKRNKESPERLLNEIEATKLSDIKFKIMVIRMLKELLDKYKKLSENYSSMKREIENKRKTRKKWT